MKQLLLTLALLSGAAHAEFKDGNKLLSDMTGSHGTQMLALGYVMGVADALNGATHCMPTNVSAGQLHDMTKKYLEDNPVVRHFSADAVIHRMLANLWPCDKKKGNTL